MPQRDPVKEPEKLHVFWFGQEMNDQAKRGLRELGERFPNSEKILWALPRQRPGETGRLQAAEFMRQYRAEAEPNGFETRHVMDHVDELARAVEPKYNKDTIRDILHTEMGNQGYIAGKDLAVYLVQANDPSLAVDLSHHHMRDAEWEEVKRNPNFSDAVIAPVDFSTAELKVVDLSHGQDANYRHVLHSGYEAMAEHHDEAGIDYQMMPHLDVFASYARKDTRGQETFKTAANQYLGYYATLAREEEKNGNVVFDERSDDKSFKPVSINLAPGNRLGAKFNPQDPSRSDIIGRMAVSALADGVHHVYGNPHTPPGTPQPPPAMAGDKTPAMPQRQVAPQVWRDIGMQAFQLEGGVRALPQLSLGKEFGNSWRTEGVQDPRDLTHLDGKKVTVVQASNLGVREAAALGMQGLDKPAKIPYEVHYSTSADNSPRRTPSPTQTQPTTQQLASDVAGLRLPGNAPEPGTSDQAHNAGQQVPRPPAVQRSNTAPGK